MVYARDTNVSVNRTREEIISHQIKESYRIDLMPPLLPMLAPRRTD